jgi:AraC family transcriptional regulator
MGKKKRNERELASAGRILPSGEGQEGMGVKTHLLQVQADSASLSGAPAHWLIVYAGNSGDTGFSHDGPPHRRHQTYTDGNPSRRSSASEDGDAGFKVLRLRVPEALFKQIANDFGSGLGSAARAPRFKRHDRQPEGKASVIEADLENDAPPNGLTAGGSGLAVAIRLIGEQNPHPGSGPGLSVAQRREVMEFIGCNIGQPLPLAVLAKVAGLSVSHFKTLFRSTFGMPVHQYVMRRRVGQAERLLLSGDMSLSQIALETGFSDQSHLSRCMRKILGVTPGAIVRLRN